MNVKILAILFNSSSGLSGDAWKSLSTLDSPTRSKDKIGAEQFLRNVRISSRLSLVGIECPRTKRSKPELLQCSSASVNPRALVTVYPASSRSIRRVASKWMSYETESMRLDMAQASNFE